MTLFAAMVAAALAWQPAAGWTATPDPVASVYARPGGTIRFSGGQPPKSYNGYVDNNSYTMMMFSLMYEPLLSTDSETLEFVPTLARRWAVSDDGDTFAFELDPAAKWSDGEPVTAADVKWTFDAVTATTSDTGSWKMILGVFESPETVGERTVRFRKKPGSPKDWRDLMSCGTFPILPAHAFRGRDFNKLSLADAPVSGPYRLARVEEQVESEFRRNRGWWRGGRADCRHTANFERIVLRYFADNENAFEAFKQRLVDVYPVYSARIMTHGARGEKFDRNWILARRVFNHKPMGFQGFAMNMRRPPFDDVRVRRAMAKLLDRETMNRTMMSGEYFLMNSYFQDLYDAEHPCANESFAYDPEGAKALLEAAGFGKGFEFTFLSRSDGEDKFLSVYAHALAQCGIKMHIVRKDFAGWMRDMDEFNFDMTWAAWGAGVFRAPESMWLGKEADRTGSNNVVGFRNAEVDRLIEAEKSMATMAERREAYRRMDKLIAAECPYVLLWNINQVRLLYWNKFGMPATVLSRYGDEDSVLTYWWYDSDRAEELRSAMKRGGYLPAVPLKVEFDAEAGK